MAMNVTLLAHTPEPDQIVAAAAKICYSDITAGDLLQAQEQNLSRKLIAELFKSGHLSTFEHVNFTFGIDGLSRVASHQLVRHRVASFSQQSQRYVQMNFSPDSIIIPPSIQDNPEALKIFQEQAESAHNTYKNLLEMGITKEDARFILPHGYSTRLVMTMNARELHHFFSLRLCRRAQWEIHELARKMLILVREKAPVLFEKAGPSCIFGKCEESRSCNKPYRNMEDLLLV
ncbi:MAG: FAD-dependent thymidylate synthase [Synergistaceae bacterium]|nr:FAD-dependent thymidylate synthase [Synergistaceae bacterium]